jgi:sulfite exporter TauE/SafE
VGEVALPGLLGAFVLGLASGSGPCMGTCAPIVLPLAAATSRSALDGFKVAAAACAGRVLAYVALGAAAGLLGGAVASRAADAWLWHVYVACGVAAAALGGYYLAKAFTCPRIETGVTNPFLLGVLLGLAPCGPLTVMLVEAFASGSAAGGVALVLAFGAGSSLPLLLSGGFIGQLVRHIQSGGDLARSVQRVSGALLVVAGARFMWTAYALEAAAVP